MNDTSNKLFPQDDNYSNIGDTELKKSATNTNSYVCNNCKCVFSSNLVADRCIMCNSTNLSNKMLYVISIIEAEKGKQGDIFVNGDLNNKFQPYFREKV